MNIKKKYQPPFVLTRTIAQMTEEASSAIELSTYEGENCFDRAISATLAIEGSKLTEAQIREIRGGKYPDASAREIREGEGAITAYSRLDRWKPQSEADILEAHAAFVGGFSQTAGSYRTKGARIVNGTRTIHVAPPPDRVPELMEDLMEWLARGELHPIQRALVFHYEFEFIHPFAEGNGWLGRLWQRAILLAWNSQTMRLSLENALLERRGEYFQSLKLSTRQTDCAPYVEFALRSLLRLLGIRFIETPESASAVLVGQYAPNEDSDNTVYPPSPLPEVLEPAQDADGSGGEMGFHIGTIPDMPLVPDTHLADTAAEMARIDEAIRIAEIMGRAESKRQAEVSATAGVIMDEGTTPDATVEETEPAPAAYQDLCEQPVAGELPGGLLVPEDAGENNIVRIMVEAVYVPEDDGVSENVADGSGAFEPAQDDADVQESKYIHEPCESISEISGFQARADEEISPIEDVASSEVASRVEAVSQTVDFGPHVPRLLRAFNGEMSGSELQEVLGLRDRKSFRERYITPALKEGLIEMTIPDKPNSRLQKYRLTDKAKGIGVS